MKAIIKYVRSKGNTEVGPNYLHMKNGGMLMHGIWKQKRIMGLLDSYPEMALWGPWFRVWHYGWRRVHRK